MADDRRQTRLEAAGYIGRREQLIFSAIATAVGALIGSVFLAIGLNVVFGPEWYQANTVAGGALGAAAGLLIARIKIKQGNLEALEAVEDGEWRRIMREEKRR